jgi:hypothetical protein
MRTAALEALTLAAIAGSTAAVLYWPGLFRLIAGL